jgi:hypothetical protein
MATPMMIRTRMLKGTALRLCVPIGMAVVMAGVLLYSVVRAGAGQASRVVIFQAPMADQTVIQPAMTATRAQVGMGGTCSSRGPPPGPIVVPPAGGRLELVHGDPDHEALAVHEVRP